MFQKVLDFFFVAVAGRHSSNSTVREVSEVSVKFVATSLRQRKQNNGENIYQVLVITLYQICKVQKGQTNHKTSCQSISFNLLTNFLHLKISYMVKSACQ